VFEILVVGDVVVSRLGLPVLKERQEDSSKELGTEKEKRDEL
jgi:hypothetical protein